MIIFRSSSFLAVSLLLVFAPLSTGQERLQEKAGVTAVEVPVRIFLKGQALKQLTAEDFQIFENGIKQDIRAFEVISRRISIPKAISPEEMKIPAKKRIFILIFNIFDYTENVGEGIDYFFKNIFRSGDWIVILTEDKLLNIELGKPLPDVIQDLKTTLKQYKKISSTRTYKIYNELRFEADRLLEAFRSGEKWEQAVLRFYQNYKRIWLDYKKQYITPDVELYRSVAKRVKQMEGEKWTLCFQQRELFPKLKNEGRLEFEIKQKLETPSGDPVWEVARRTIVAQQMELERVLDVTSNFPTEALKSLFMEANISFDLILMKSLRADLLSEDFELREVAQDYEDCFKKISSSTGGFATFSNKVVEALEEASHIEDYYYLIVYYTKHNEPNAEITIDVKVNREGANAVHLKKFSKETIPHILIADFKKEEKTVRFALKNFVMTKIKGRMAGMAEVKMTLFNDRSEKIFDEAKVLDLLKKEVQISLNFGKEKPGRYYMIIQAIDKISNELDVFSRQIELQ